MNTNTLDEDSIRVHINLINTKENTETKIVSSFFQKYVLNSAKEYVSSLYYYVIDRYFLLRKMLAVMIARVSVVTYHMKSYIVTKMFWGRGSLYRYIAFFSIFIPIVVSIAIIGYSRYQPSVEKKITITNALINQATQNTNKFAVEGKLVETQSTPTNNPSEPLTSWYTVKQSDTLDSIAKAYDISTDTIVWANNLPTNSVTPGQILKIEPVKGVIHTVEANDTIPTLAKMYAVSETDIQAWNLLDTTQPLPVGKKILIPGITHETTIANINFAYIHTGPSVGCPQGDYWCYTQVDSRWGSLILGGSGRQNAYSYYNVDHIGCLITDVAMIATYYYPNKGITPATIAVQPQYFVGGGLFTLSGLGLFDVTPLNGWTAIDNQLTLGHPVIVYVGYPNHYVVLYQKVGNDYLMQDPAYGGALLFSKYYHAGYVSQAYLYTPIGK